MYVWVELSTHLGVRSQTLSTGWVLWITWIAALLASSCCSHPSPLAMPANCPPSLVPISVCLSLWLLFLHSSCRFKFQNRPKAVAAFAFPSSIAAFSALDQNSQISLLIAGFTAVSFRVLNDVWVGLLCRNCWWQWNLLKLLSLTLMSFLEVYSNHLWEGVTDIVWWRDSWITTHMEL